MKAFQAVFAGSFVVMLVIFFTVDWIPSSRLQLEKVNDLLPWWRGRDKVVTPTAHEHGREAADGLPNVYEHNRGVADGLSNVYGHGRNVFDGSVTVPHKGMVQTRKRNSTFQCLPRTNFVFMKVHKAGSTTTAAIMARFALRKNLSVLSPVSGGGIHSPWADTCCYHTPDEVYNVLFHHTVYNREWMDNIFPPHTAYLAILRHPFSQLKSTFNFYGIDKNLPFENKENPLKEFLGDPTKYPTSFTLSGVLVDKTRNPQAFDMGYPVEKAADMKTGREYIQRLGRDFTHVLILEYFDHSLVMLRRLMCWETRDILYDMSPRRQKMYPYRSYRPNGAESEAHRRWSPVDYALYQHFNQTLWREIARVGPDFYEELAFFRDINQQVNEFCRQKKPRTTKHIPESPWGGDFHVTDQFCSLLHMFFKDIDAKIGKQQNRPVLAVPCEDRGVGPTVTIPFFLQGGQIIATFRDVLKFKKHATRLTRQQEKSFKKMEKNLRSCQKTQKRMKDVYIEGMGNFKVKE